MGYVYFDLETIPAHDTRFLDQIRSSIADDVERISAPSNYKDQDKIDAYVEERRDAIESSFDERRRATALDASYGGEVWCIGWASGDTPVQIVSRRDYESETAMISAWSDRISDYIRGDGHGWPKYVGHNVNKFDAPFLWRRSRIIGARLPAGFPSPLAIRGWGGGPTDDTMLMWTGDPRSYIKLRKLASILGVADGVDAIDGSGVWDSITEGRQRDVISHCIEDVRILRDVHRRLTS